MKSYIIRRILLIIPNVILVSMIVFLLVRIVPGNVVDLMAADLGSYRQIDKDEIEHKLGLDVDIFTQYGRWTGVVPNEDGKLDGILQGNFGVSLWTATTVMDEIKVRLPVTLELGIFGLLIAHLIALPLGVFSALRRETIGDWVARSFAILCIAVPSFWLATMVVIFPAIWWGYMPSITWIPFTKDPLGNLQMVIVPSIILGLQMSGTTTRLTRNRMIGVLGQDYIRTAWAKGLKESVIVKRHALKNALIPVITMTGIQIGAIFGGTVIIEKIFGIPGMGRLIVDAVTNRDYPVVSGVLFFTAFFVMLVNLIVDLSYALLDPKVRYK